MREKIRLYTDNVHAGLLVRQVIFLVIAAVLLAICIVNMYRGIIGPTLSISGFFLAGGIGLLMSRMFKIYWHEEKGKVVAHLDRQGVVLLALYISVELGRKWLFEHWLTGAALNAFGLVILTGLLLGRFFGTHILITQVLTSSEDVLAD